MKKLIKKYLWNQPHSLTSEDWNYWEIKMKNKYPIKYFIFETVPYYLDYPIIYLNNIKRWIKYRTTNVYHKINTNLKPNYYDTDTLILHSSFTLLVNFVEKKHALEFIDWNWNKNHKNVSKEIIFLLNWWRAREERNRIWLTHNPEPDEYRTTEWCDWVEKYNKQETNWYTEDNEMLIRLINIREYLWT